MQEGWSLVVRWVSYVFTVEKRRILLHLLVLIIQSINSAAKAVITARFVGTTQKSVLYNQHIPQMTWYALWTPFYIVRNMFYLSGN